MLDKRTYKLLRYLYKKGSCDLGEVSKITGHTEPEMASANVSLLSSHHLIDAIGYSNDVGEWITTGYSINLSGAAYVEQRRRDTRQFWVPYAITTGIALLSLVGTLADHWDTIRCWALHLFS